MRFCGRGMILIDVAVAGLALTALAAPPAAAGQSVTRSASHCIEVTATIPLARASSAIAVNPKTTPCMSPTAVTR